MAGSGVALWCVPSCVGGALKFPDDEEAGHEEGHDEYREGRTAGPVEILSGEAVVDHGAREEVARAAEEVGDHESAGRLDEDEGGAGRDAWADEGQDDVEEGLARRSTEVRGGFEKPAIEFLERIHERPDHERQKVMNHADEAGGGSVEPLAGGWGDAEGTGEFSEDAVAAEEAHP